MDAADFAWRVGEIHALLQYAHRAAGTTSAPAKGLVEWFGFAEKP